MYPICEKEFRLTTFTLFSAPRYQLYEYFPFNSTTSLMVSDKQLQRSGNGDYFYHQAAAAAAASSSSHLPVSKYDAGDQIRRAASTVGEPSAAQYRRVNRAPSAGVLAPVSTSSSYKPARPCNVGRRVIKDGGATSYSSAVAPPPSALAVDDSVDRSPVTVRRAVVQQVPVVRNKVSRPRYTISFASDH